MYIYTCAQTRVDTTNQFKYVSYSSANNTSAGQNNSSQSIERNQMNLTFVKSTDRK